MPYNSNPIITPDEATGTTQLPLARVKKIIQADPDVSSCSNNASFAISIAAQLFIQHLVEQTHNVVKSERKPRRNIQYRDVANAVARIDNLEFLTDVVPRTTTFKKYKDKKSKEEAAAALKNGDLPINGQRTLDSLPKRDLEDEPMMDIDQGVMVPNIAAPAAEDLGSHSPTVARSATQARLNFDAVRNGFQDDSRNIVPMEE